MKKTFKSAVLMLLVCAMAVSLCACGSSEDKSSAPAGEKTAEPVQTAEAQEAVEYAYKAEFTRLADDDAYSNISASCWTDSGFYGIGSEIVGSHAPEGVEPQYYGQFFDEEPRIFFVGFDGTVKTLENYVPVAAPATPFGDASKEDAEPAEDEGAGAEDGYYEHHPCDGVYDFSVISNNSAVRVNGEGNLVVVETQYLSWADTDEFSRESDEYWDHYKYTNNSFVRVLDPTGKELSTVKIEVGPTEWMYSEGITDAEGNIIFTKNSETGEYFIVGIDTSTGATSYEIQMDNPVNIVMKTADGKLFISVWGNNGNEFLPFDTATKTFGNPLPLPNDAWQIVTGGGEYPVYYTSGVWLYGFDPEAENPEPVKLFNWMDCDINSDDTWNISVDENGFVRVLLNNFDSYSMTYDRCIASVAKAPVDPSSQKKELILATQYLGYELKNAVIDFNRKSDSVHITVKDYSEYNTEEDYSAGLTKLQTEIIAGNCPDIIDMQGMSASQLASKGLLEDLYPYFDADPELNRDDYLPNALKAAEYDGKLIHTASYFTLGTVVGASSIVGEEPGITYDGLYAALKEMPDGCTPFDVTTTRDEILNICLNLDMADFVDWGTGEVNFDNDEFVDLLKFAATFPETYDWEQYDYTVDSTDARIKEGRQMLYATYISTVDDLMYIEASYNGTPVTFVGYPTNSGTGNTIQIDPGLAMSASCSDKDAAWNFMRNCFTGRFFENTYSYYGLPLQKEILEKRLKKACTVTYEIDEYGSYVLDENGEKIPQQHYYGMNDGVYSYYCLSKDMAEKFNDLLVSTDKISTVDQSIKDIVTKQAAAFFSGQKSAEEVAKLVQSNAKIYVNEQR